MAASGGSSGTISLVLGILSLFGGTLVGVGGPLFALPAIWLGNGAMRFNAPGASQYSQGNIGKVMGVISLWLTFGWLVLAIGFAIVLGGFGALLAVLRAHGL